MVNVAFHACVAIHQADIIRQGEPIQIIQAATGQEPVGIQQHGALAVQDLLGVPGIGNVQIPQLLNRFGIDGQTVGGIEVDVVGLGSPEHAEQGPGHVCHRHLFRQIIPGGGLNGHLMLRIVWPFPQVALVCDQVLLILEAVVLQSGVPLFSHLFPVVEDHTVDAVCGGVDDLEHIRGVQIHGAAVGFQDNGAVGAAIFHPVSQLEINPINLFL